MRKIETALFMAFLIFALFACSRSSMQMTQIHAEEKFLGKPIKDVLVIVVIDDQEIRAIFEKHFVDWLAVKGVEAITSVGVLPVNLGTKLKKEVIIEVVDKYENDSILITNLVGFQESEVFSRDRPRFFYNYYGFYNYAWGYVYWPTIYGEKIQFSLETGLYDVKTESLIWAGESHLKNPETTGQAIGHVVDMVMKDLEENGFLPKKP